MVSVLEEFLRRHDVVPTDNLKSSIPKHWERHGDLVMFDDSLQDPVWRITVLSCKRIAQKGSIASNGYRTPQVCMLLGQDSWVEHVDNGIRYTYDVTKCMFSSGNVTEKLRVSRFHCESETVVDLYAGIGYFTLPYLVHAKAHLVHACEWNPDAAEALKRNLRLNGVEDRCVVHHGDNREGVELRSPECEADAQPAELPRLSPNEGKNLERNLCPKDIADRVNLGLIPLSEPGWETACRALKKCSGGVLHIHGNVETKKSTTKPNENSHGAHCTECSNGKPENDEGIHRKKSMTKI
uniref:tRNA(Phe) (4-demethylwyosine(37)-C(7)) aminocarboxypropyltransferase n=1 Tax=Crassostrea virginica TaxID=6565 RepID=A0A8B8E609_CRAVI|nr:tRNA wybutosine-synthesizing protein 2 homolog [Crassostrea virginica]